ncbi:MAG: hypothetical protein JNM93_07445 [Bacteriovoracaceae bacterium]|nr:hypothetical protein [Bacteriovoracaceae bacterium]
MIANLALQKTDLSILNIQLNPVQKNFETKTASLDNFSEDNFDALLISNENMDEQMINFLNNNKNRYPVDQVTTYSSALDIENLDFNSLWSILDKVSTRWSLRNNLESLDNLFAIEKNLRQLWLKDRHAFCTELWQFIKYNLHATSLKLIFQGLKETAEDAKPELQFLTVQGSKLPEIQNSSNIEAEIIKKHKKSFAPGLNVIEFNTQNNRLVLAIQIQNSPILVMAEIIKFSPLQKTLLSSLINGLNS